MPIRAWPGLALPSHASPRLACVALPGLAAPSPAAPCLRCQAKPRRAGPCLVVPAMPSRALPGLATPRLRCLSAPRPDMPCLTCQAIPSRAGRSPAKPAEPCLSGQRHAGPSRSGVGVKSHPTECASGEFVAVARVITYSSVKVPQPIPALAFESGLPSPMPTCWPTRSRRLATSVALNWSVS